MKRIMLFGVLAVVVAVILYVVVQICTVTPINPAITALLEKYPAPAESENGWVTFLSYKPPSVTSEGQAALLDDPAWSGKYDLLCWSSTQRFLQERTQEGMEILPCLPAEEIDAVLTKNAALFAHLRKIMAMPRYYQVEAKIDHATTPTHTGPAYPMNELQKFFAMGITRKASAGNAEEAYQDWVLQRRFANTALNDVQDRVGKTMALVVSNYNMTAFEKLYGCTRTKLTHCSQQKSIAVPLWIQCS